MCCSFPLNRYSILDSAIHAFVTVSSWLWMRYRLVRSAPESRLQRLFSKTSTFRIARCLSHSKPLRVPRESIVSQVDTALKLMTKFDAALEQSLAAQSLLQIVTCAVFTLKWTPSFRVRIQFRVTITCCFRMLNLASRCYCNWVATLSTLHSRGDSQSPFDLIQQNYKVFPHYLISNNVLYVSLWNAEYF